MTTLVFAVLSGLGIMLASLVGVLFAYGAFGRWMHAHLTYLATFAGGVFVVVIYHLIEEALHESPSLLSVGISILIGAALIEIVHRLLPDAHHHHDMDHGHSHSRIDARRVLASDAIHNIADGFLLVAAFAADIRVGIVAAIGIFIHELVQEISEFFVLKESGLTTRQALSRNLMASSTILIGIIAAFFLVSSESIAALIAGVAAGGFLNVIVRDLIPNALASSRRKHTHRMHVVALIAGIALMLAVVALTPHEEPDEQHLAGVISVRLG